MVMPRAKAFVMSAFQYAEFDFNWSEFLTAVSGFILM